MLTARFGSLISPALRLRRGRRLAKAGQAVRAFAMVAPLAKRGMPEAQLWVARAYLEGRAVPVSQPDASRWCERAARAGLVEAQTLMASLRLSAVDGTIAGVGTVAGDGANPTDRSAGNVEEAVYWAKQAAEAGGADAKALLAYLYAAGPDAMRDPDLSKALYRESAISGSPQGALGHGLTLLSSANEAHRENAYEWIQKAADANLPFALYLSGLIRENGIGVERDVPAAMAFYRLAAERGVCHGQMRFGMALLAGQGIPRNVVAAETWLRRAALAGETNAAVTIGTIYATPGDLPPNYLEAARWFTLAAEGGNKQAARALGALYSQGGNGVERDKAQAAVWLCRAAERIVEARYRYGRMLYEGRGVAINYAESRGWLILAANADHVEAKVLLAEMMLNARGGPADPAAALVMFLAAAEHNHLGAMFAAGVILSGGHGVRRDGGRAQKLFKLAAEQGHAFAQLALGRFLLHGSAGEKDLEQARYWFKKAQAQGLSEAVVDLEGLGAVMESV